MTKVEILEQIAKVASKLANTLEMKATYDEKISYCKTREDYSDDAVQGLVVRYIEYSKEYTDKADELQTKLYSLIQQLQNAIK